MKTINLTIPNMKSHHCQLTVRNVVSAVGANVKAISEAKAEIELSPGLTMDDVISVIQKAGYNVTNETR